MLVFTEFGALGSAMAAVDAPPLEGQFGSLASAERIPDPAIIRNELIATNAWWTEG